MIFVVIPAHDNRATVLECRACLGRQTNRAVQVILVDDGSTDGTAEAVACQYPETVILKGDGNLWWAGAMARGVEYVLGHCGDGDFLLALNNDLTFDEHLLDALTEGSRKYPGAIVSSVVYDARDRACVLDAGQFFNGTTTTRALQPGCDANLDTNVTTGRGVLFPVEVFRSAGNYAERWLPHYHSDFEMALRAQRHGFYLVTYYKAKIYLRAEITGFGESLFKKRTPRELWAMAVSRRSVRDLRSTLAFLVLACPLKYAPRYVLKELVYAFWVYTGFTPLWQIRRPLATACRLLFPDWYHRHEAELQESGDAHHPLPLSGDRLP